MNNKKNFCISPWIHLHTWPNDQVYPCCMTPMENPVGNLKKNSLEEIWNSSKMKDLRVEFLKDNRPASCNRCFEMEDAGQQSWRQSLNQHYKHHFDKTDNTLPDGNFEDFNLVYWDFRFNNICNFKCRTCGPQLSTGWYEDTKKIWGSLPNDIKVVDNDIQTWEEIEPLFSSVEEIYFAGGEPLIMEEHYRILKRLDEMKRYDVKLRYNTNFSQLEYKNLKVYEIWKKFQSVELSASLDGSGPKGEYIRKNMKWSKILENREKINPVPNNIYFYINFTLSVMNCFHVVDFHRECVETGFIETPDQFRLNVLQHPLHFRLQILPNDLKIKLIECYEKYIEDLSKLENSESIINDFRAAINFIQSENYTHEIDNFKKYIRQLDNIRKEKFSNIFPELSELME
jgi:radical SAM protein with 4Fe4S-binding SPASM domain